MGTEFFFVVELERFMVEFLFFWKSRWRWTKYCRDGVTCWNSTWNTSSGQDSLEFTYFVTDGSFTADSGQLKPTGSVNTTLQMPREYFENIWEKWIRERVGWIDTRRSRTNNLSRSLDKCCKRNVTRDRIGMIGPAKHLDEDLEVLHRSVRVINDELMEIEVDLKHVSSAAGRSGTHWRYIVKTPRVKLSAAEVDAIENSPIYEGEEATFFRSGIMRCAYLAQDRVDIYEKIKSLAREMLKPRAGHMMQLKRVARHLKGVPRKPQQFPAREPSRSHWKCTWTVTGLETR